MSSFVWLGLTAFFVVVVVLSHWAPKGGKPVAGTRLMKNARGILIVGMVLCGALGLWTVFKH
jgi:hypothetical protein